jgi:hypothetical protein
MQEPLQVHDQESADWGDAPHAVQDYQYVCGAFGRFSVDYWCEPVFLQKFPESHLRLHGPENHHCPRIDVDAQVLMLVVEERLIFSSARGVAPAVAQGIVQEIR